MQVNANSQLQMQTYTKLQQQSAPVTQQSAGNKTLQSDTVTFSQQAIAASDASLGRNGSIIITLPGTLR